MMNKRFDKYGITYIGGPNEVNKRIAYISCYDGNTQVGLLQFFHNAAEVEENSYNGRVVYLTYEMSQFRDMLQILEYEKPLYIYYEESSHYGYVGTWEKEPSGEQEGR